MSTNHDSASSPVPGGGGAERSEAEGAQGPLYKDVMASSLAKGRAKELRRGMTPPERTLWKHLRGKRLGGIRFRRQHPIGPFIADFYCHDAKLVVEIDSSAHDGRKPYDANRDEWMRANGIRVVRVMASDVTDHTEGVIKLIKEAVGG